jgi:P4 family phage/plasmid primase-like protien
MPPKSAPRQTSQSVRRSKELLNGQDLWKCLDYINDIVPLENQVYTINGDKEIDQKLVLKDMIKSLRGGQFPVNYLYSKSAVSHGRQYARNGRSVQSLSRVLRHTLCAKTYRDFDIENCHPTIAHQYCKKHGWDVTFLEQYVLNRKQHLDDIMEKNNITKDTAKTIILSILNGGKKGYYSLTHKTPFITGLFNEIDGIFRMMMDEPENQSLIDEVKTIGKKKQPHEIRRSVCNRVWVDIENTILNSCISWLEYMNLSIEFIVLMFDGFMLPKTVLMPYNWATLLSDYVFNNVGYKMNFTEKIMDEGVDLDSFAIKTMYNPSNNNEVDDNLLHTFIDSKSDIDMMEIISQAFGRYYAYDGDTLFVFKNHRWCDYGDLQFVKDVPSLHTLFLPFLNTTGDDAETAKDYNKSVKASINMFNNIKKIETVKRAFYARVHNPTFKDMLDSNKNLLGFTNGVIDLNTDTKELRDGKPEDFISLSTGYAFVKVATTELADKFINDIMAPDSVNAMKSHLASICRGGNDENKFNFWVGKGGNGKSLLCNAIKMSLGDYMGYLQKEVYTKEKKNSGGADPHIKETRGRRMALTAETDEGDIFLSSVVKTNSSTDVIKCRGLFEKKEVKFIPQFKPIIMTNHLPTFSSMDDGLDRRLRIFEFPYSFVHNPIGDSQKLRDEQLPILVQSDIFCNQLINLMIYGDPKIVESPSMIRKLGQYRKDLNPIQEWFEDALEATQNDKDTLSTSALFTSYLNENDGIKISRNQFSSFLDRLSPIFKTKNGAVIKGFKMVDREVKSDTE